MSSDSLINYGLRPSKAIERKMILSVLKEVCTPTVSNEYQYIGFGASFFIDFKLFHTSLGINEMTSIESNVSPDGRKRCKFNRPYDCITLVPGKSHEVLPKLKWNLKSIVWLDYDKGLQNYMFKDIETCCVNAKPNGFLILTLRNDFLEDNFEQFKENFERFLPKDFDEEGFEPGLSSITIRQMFLNSISEVLINSQSSTEEEDKLIFMPLFNYIYADGTEMYSFGGMFVRAGDIDQFKQYQFNNYTFISDREEPINISFPIITNKEYHLLNQFLPKQKDEFDEIGEISFIPKTHRDTYKEVYLHYPAYIESREL